MQLTDLIWIGIGMIIGFLIFKPMFVFKWHPREAKTINQNEKSKKFCETCNTVLTRFGACYNDSCPDNDLPW